MAHGLWIRGFDALPEDDENKVITVITPGANQIVISDKDKSILLKDQNNNKVQLNWTRYSSYKIPLLLIHQSHLILSTEP